MIFAKQIEDIIVQNEEALMLRAIDHEKGIQKATKEVKQQSKKADVPRIVKQMSKK